MRTARPHPQLRESAAIFGCSLLVLLLIAHLDPGIDLTGPTLSASIDVLLLNVLPALAAFGLLLALIRRLLLSSWLLVLALGGLYAANSAKLQTLQTPLLPSDLLFISAPGPALHLFVQYLHVDAVHWIALAIGIVITGVLLRERPLRMLRGWRAALLGLVAFVATVSLVVGTTPWRRVYRSAQASFQPWSLSDSVAHTGLLGSLLLYHWNIGGGTVPTADRAAAIALLQAHAPELRAGLSARTAATDLPDIVIVQSESLFDPARMRGVLSGRYLPQYHRLAADSRAGDLQVPTFGGGTIRTEFEVLTGAPLASLGGIQYPWLELNRYEYPGLTRVLDEHGYQTIAIHPNSSAFWNRAATYPALGFDQFIDSESLPKDRIVGLFTSDAAMTDRILEELRDDGPPRFVFAISMENHGPFDWRPGLDQKRLDALQMPEKLDAGGRLWLGNYLYLLDDADQQLGRLADALAKRKRRTLLLFYGDHLPGLAPVYDQLGFDDDRDAKSQPVPWLLLDNTNPHPHRIDTRSWLLPGLLLNVAGIDDNPYFNVLASLARDPGFKPDDASTAAGIDALARLHLRGELPPVLDESLGIALPKVSLQ